MHCRRLARSRRHRVWPSPSISPGPTSLRPLPLSRLAYNTGAWLGQAGSGGGALRPGRQRQQRRSRGGPGAPRVNDLAPSRSRNKATARRPLPPFSFSSRLAPPPSSFLPSSSFSAFRPCLLFSGAPSLLRSARDRAGPPPGLPPGPRGCRPGRPVGRQLRLWRAAMQCGLVYPSLRGRSGSVRRQHASRSKSKALHRQCLARCRATVPRATGASLKCRDRGYFVNARE